MKRKIFGVILILTFAGVVATAIFTSGASEDIERRAHILVALPQKLNDKPHRTAFAVMTDGRILWSAADGWPHVVDPRTGRDARAQFLVDVFAHDRDLAREYPRGPTNWAISPDGKWIVSFLQTANGPHRRPPMWLLVRLDGSKLVKVAMPVAYLTGACWQADGSGWTGFWIDKISLLSHVTRYSLTGVIERDTTVAYAVVHPIGPVRKDQVIVTVHQFDTPGPTASLSLGGSKTALVELGLPAGGATEGSLPSGDDVVVSVVTVPFPPLVLMLHRHELRYEVILSNLTRKTSRQLAIGTCRAESEAGSEVGDWPYGLQCSPDGTAVVFYYHQAIWEMPLG